LKPIRKKDASSFTECNELFEKYLARSFTLKITDQEIRENFSAGVRNYGDKVAKLEKNMDIGAHEMEVNSQILNYLAKGIKNSAKNDLMNLTAMYDI
jgi:hypothetical protein